MPVGVFCCETGKNCTEVEYQGCQREDNCGKTVCALDQHVKTLFDLRNGNSTLVAEYLLGEMWRRDYFIHRSLVQFLRTTVASYRPEASVDTPAPYRLKFHYFAAYNRAKPSRWNAAESAGVPAATRTAQLAAFKQITGNLFRMALLLHEDALDRGLIAPYGNTSTQDGDFEVINDFFNYAGLPGRDADDALLRRVAAKAGKTLTF